REVGCLAPSRTECGSQLRRRALATARRPAGETARRAARDRNRNTTGSRHSARRPRETTDDAASAAGGRRSCTNRIRESTRRQAPARAGAESPGPCRSATRRDVPGAPAVVRRVEISIVTVIAAEQLVAPIAADHDLDVTAREACQQP